MVRKKVGCNLGGLSQCNLSSMKEKAPVSSTTWPRGSGTPRSVEEELPGSCPTKQNQQLSVLQPHEAWFDTQHNPQYGPCTFSTSRVAMQIQARASRQWRETSHYTRSSIPCLIIPKSKLITVSSRFSPSRKEAATEQSRTKP